MVSAGWITASLLQELGGVGHQDFGREEVPGEQVEEQPTTQHTLPVGQKELWAPWNKAIPVPSSSQ